MPDKTAVIKCFLTIGLMNSFVRGVHFGTQYQAEGRAALSQTSHHNGASMSSTLHQLYSPWSPWSSCSLTCGQGISVRTRVCQKRHSNSDRMSESLCHGETTEHKICKVQECPPNTLDFRSFQCSQFNNRLIGGHRPKSWTPANGGANPCELRCEATAERLVYGFGKAADGTLCSQGVCLDGRCLKIGCDDRIGSRAEWDMCGLCAGRNATCVHYVDVFSGQPKSRPSYEERGEYQEVVVLPTGARNFTLRKDIDNNILAIRDRNAALLFHENVLKLNEEQPIAGTTVIYSRENNVTEVLTAKGPIVTELYVMVLLRKRNRGIHYEYWIPNERSHRSEIHRVRPVAYSTYSPEEQHRATIPTESSDRHKTFGQPVPTPGYIALQSTYIPIQTTTSYPRTTRSSLQYTVQRLPKSTEIRKTEASTSISPNYGPKRLALVIPRAHAPVPLTAKSSNPVKSKDRFSAGVDILHPASRVDNSIPRFRVNHKTQKPEYNYYQKYRNNSYHYPQTNLYQRKSVYLPPHQTQGDSSAPSDRKNIAISKDVDKDPKLQDDTKWNKKLYYKNTNLSSRWEYRINGKRNESSGKGSLVVLPLPDYVNGSLSRRQSKKRAKHFPKSRLTRGGLCEPCQRVRDQTKHFCSSDFVIHAAVLGYEFLHGETRYELEVLQSFKNILSLLSREYIWSPDTCRCPKLRIGQEYILMGKIDNNYRRNESRLLVDKSCFVRTFNLKHGRRLHKLRKSRARKCSSKVS